MTKESADKTAFRLPDGSLFQYKVAPFGLVCLPSIFTRCMHTVLGDTLKDHACVYVDDILVHSKTVEEHIKHLGGVLQRVRAYGMTVSRHKCQLFKPEVKYLGHKVGWYGTRACEDKVKAMVDMSPPLKGGKVDKRLMQVALGCFNYYRRYIHQFARIAAPLVECTKDGCDMLWNRERQDAYRELKEKMSKAPVIMNADFELPFSLHTDASKTAVAGVLTQYVPLETLKERSPEGGEFPWASIGRVRKVEGKAVREVVVGFFSMINSELDAKMGATALECLGVVLALHHFRPYVWGRPVTVVTDAAALRWLLSLNDSNGKLLRWAMRLQEYDILVVHRAGKLSSNADGMSRLPQMAEVNAPRLKEHAEENWPECVEIGPAPPSGVRFDGEEDWMESAANVGSVGAHASPLSDQPSFKLAAVALASGALAQSLADLSDAGAHALARCAVDEAPCSDITTLFEVQGDDASPCRAFDDLPASVMALTSKARGDDVDGTDGDADRDSEKRRAKSPALRSPRCC